MCFHSTVFRSSDLFNLVRQQRNRTYGCGDDESGRAIWTQGSQSLGLSGSHVYYRVRSRCLKRNNLFAVVV